MALRVKKNDVWKHYRITAGDGFIQVREYRDRGTFMFLSLCFAPSIFLGFVYYFKYGYFDWVPAVICLFISIFMFALALPEYNAPRLLILHPDEHLAVTKSRFFFVRYRIRRHNLADAPLATIAVEFETEEEDKPDRSRSVDQRGARGLIEGLTSLIDPIEPVVEFVKMIIQPKCLVSGYGLVLSNPDNEMLAVFRDPSELQHLLDAYDCCLSRVESGNCLTPPDTPPGG